MALTLGQVADGVRDLHPAFDRRLIQDQVLARFYTRYQRRLVYEVIRINPDVLITETNIPYTVSLLMGSAGFAIPAFLGVRSPGTVHFTADTQRLGELTLLKHQDRLSPLGLYPAFVRGTTLFLIGVAEDWVGVASIDLPYIPVPAILTAPTDTFALPDGAYDTLVAAGGLLSARKAAARADIEIELQDFRDDAQRCEEGFLRGLGVYHSSTIHYVKEAC